MSTKFTLAKSISILQEEAYSNAKSKGFWDSPREIGTLLALIHAEVSEALEAERKGNPPDKHLPEYTSFEVELADIVIRILDLAENRKIDLGEVILAKLKFNKTRPIRHGKAF